MLPGMIAQLDVKGALLLLSTPRENHSCENISGCNQANPNVPKRQANDSFFRCRKPDGNPLGKMYEIIECRHMLRQIRTISFTPYEG